MFSFHRIPKALFTDARIRGVSAESKILYGLLLDRIGLSVKNDWTDDTSRVYIIVTTEESWKGSPRCCPPFSAAGVLVHFDSGTVQHKRCLIDYILLDQIRQYVLPYACLCPCTKSAVHTLPGAKPFGQIPPGNTCIQPVYHCIEHFPVVFAWTASLRLSFWWKQVFYSFPLRFTQFMSFHVLKFTTLAFCTQVLGFQTGSSKNRMPNEHRGLKGISSARKHQITTFLFGILHKTVDKHLDILYNILRHSCCHSAHTIVANIIKGGAQWQHS